MPEIARRSLLAALSAVPAATVAAALPMPVLAQPAGVYTADANLIAMAGRVVRWARLEGEADARLSDAEDRRDAMRPERPASITTDLDRIAANVLAEFPDPLPIDDDATLQTFVARGRAASQPLYDEHQAAMRAYRAACDKVERDSGFTDARSLATWISGRLVRSAEALTAMPAGTMAGLNAKAQAFQAVQEAGWQHCVAQWRDALAASIVADVLKIGGQANG